MGNLKKCELVEYKKALDLDHYYL